MFCPQCRHENPDVAKFCMECGANLRTAAPRQAEDQWETCEIIHYVPDDLASQWTSSFNNMFGKGSPQECRKRTIGPAGAQTTTAMKFTGDDTRGDLDRRNVEALERTISTLVADGWEVVGKGVEWYAYHFRRRITSAC